MSLTNCRFYKEKFPPVDSFVMVNVKEIAEMGAYVKLLEYDDIDGMILLSELSRRRIRSIQKLIRVGRDEVVTVLRVDATKGYIDLSKRRVSTEEMEKCEERYTKNKTVHAIMRNVAKTVNVPLEELYTEIVWPLVDKYGDAHDAFRFSITNPNVWDEALFHNDKTKAELESHIARRLTPKPTKVRADIEVTCFEYEGIDAVKRALDRAESLSTEEAPVACRLVSPPLYVLTSQTVDKAMGIKMLEDAITAVGQNIRAAGGTCEVKVAPKAVYERDDAALQALMDQRERENKEISGDENSSGSGE